MNDDTHYPRYCEPPEKRPTPETDIEQPKPQYFGNIVSADFARRLERERDEAREQRDRLAEALREIEWCNDSAWQSDRAKAALAAVEGGDQ